ncbi:MAG: alpha/beta hydrolase [Saprospiraceae bacterium]|nr:alpha/beta hydrolase [Saprospiraceae bacterium]
MRHFLQFIAMATILMATGCLRLDDYLFNPASIDAYYLDDYTGKVDFRLPPEDHIPDSLIHWVPLISSTNGKSVNIQGLYVGDLATITQDTIILYCHGNRDHLDFYWPRIQLLAQTRFDHRYGVMSLDYQGYGLSAGTPSQNGIIEDAFTALDWLIDRGVSPDKIIVYGFSMGSIPAVALAGSATLSGRGGLILEAPLASSETLVQDGSTLTLPASFLLDLDFDNIAGMAMISQPLLWIHGEDDQTTAIRTHGEPVFQAYKGVRSTAIRLPGGAHDDLPVVLGFTAYLQAVEKVLAP